MVLWQGLCVSKAPVSETGQDKITADALNLPRTVLYRALLSTPHAVLSKMRKRRSSELA